MNGFIGIDKPAGITSRDVVNHIQRLVRPAKVGHAGTLDPLATGVLVVACGKATRLIQFVQQATKRYGAEFQLGCRSDTEDITGQLQSVAVSEPPSLEQVVAATRVWIGEVEQVPPAFSALKVNGKRAYALARSGQAVDLKPRRIRIDQIEVVEYDYPRLLLDVTCGSGTYIRSLGRDIGDSLGTGGVMSALVRSAVGPFTLDQAVSLQRLGTADDVQQNLTEMAIGVAYLPRARLSSEQASALKFGRKIEGDFGSGQVAAINSAGTLLAILESDSDGRFRPSINFAT